MGIASQIGAAKQRSGGGNFIRPGSGELVIKALKDGDSPEFEDGATFVAEMGVLSSEPFNGLLDENGVVKPAGNPVGSDVCYIQQMKIFPKVAFSNIQDFILKLMGETDESMAAAAAITRQKIAERPAYLQELEAQISERVNGGLWTPAYEFAAAYMALVDRKANRARGMRIRFSTFEKRTKESKKMITLINWAHVPQTLDQIKAERAKLDGVA